MGGMTIVAISTTTQTAALPLQLPASTTADTDALVSALQQLTSTLSQLIQVLQAQMGSGGGPLASAQASAGAANLDGSADTCCGGMTAAAGGASAGPDLVAEPESATQLGSITHQATITQPDVAATVDTTAAPVPRTTGQQMVDAAMRHLGKPYKFGKAGPDMFDCSGLTRAVYREFGIDLPHMANVQQRMGTAVDRNHLQPGDLVFFAKPGEAAHHVGMYIGDGKFIHAPRTGDVVKISSLDERYFRTEFAGGRRFV